MNLRSKAETALVVAAVLFATALVLGQFFGQPVLLSYVETDSMEPTLEPGDGYVAIPTAIAGPIEEGDVVVYEAQQLHGGGLTTHRVVDDTEQGYVTKGDGNPFPDQDGSEPYVTDSQIVAKALQVNGQVVVIPNVGTAIGSIQGTMEAIQHRAAGTVGSSFRGQWLTLFLFAIGVLSLVSGALSDEGRTRSRERSRSRRGVYDRRTVVALVVAVVFIAAAGTMLASGGVQEYGVVSAESETEAGGVIPAGETRAQTVDVRNGGLVPVHAVVEPASPGVTVEPNYRHLGPRETADTTIGFSAPPETGYYVRAVSEYHYFAVLPRPVVLDLHAIHPWVAVFAVSTVLSGAAAGAMALALRTETIRTRESPPSGPITGGRSR